MSEDCLKLTTYLGERERAGDRFAADALLDVFGRHDVRTSILLRGAEGFGLKHHLRTDTLLSLSEDLPLVAVAVDTPERVEALLGDVLAIERHGLVTLERARMIAAPEQLEGEAKVTIYVGRQQRIDGAPAFMAICERLHDNGVAGASVLLGVDGTAHGERRRARFFARNADVPAMIVAVGAGERIAAALAGLELPLVTLERVRHEPGDEPLQKLTVYASQHVELVRRLREGGIAGVTCLRGVWGFHGDRAPHGDRLVQLRRHVPTVTVVVDSAERIARAYAIARDLTGASGLVTCEVVPRRF